MNKIESINLHNFRNNEHFQFMIDVNKLILFSQASVLGIDSLYPAFRSALNAEDATMRTELGSVRSKIVEELDKMRDKTWNAILLRVKSALFSPIGIETESALVIKQMIDFHGDIRVMNHNEESAAISNLISDLQMPSNADHLNLTGISMWMNELQMQNEEFKTVFNELNAEFAGRESGDVRAIRLLIDPIYGQMVEKINATVVMEVAKPIAISFVRELNEKIKYYKLTLASRINRDKEVIALVINN